MSARCGQVSCQHDGAELSSSPSSSSSSRPPRPSWSRLLQAPLALLTALLLALIWLYRLIVSPLLSALGARCRFFPTCSVYAAEALRKHGLFVGSVKAVYRLLRCHPFCRGGHDPP